MIVPPSGPTTAEYAIVGEAPGATEARQGRPFCGPSGELLDATLEKVGLNPDSVYRTNVYKDYRPGNPTPTVEEVNDHLAELAEELASLPNLKYVLAVGNTAMRALTGKSAGITKAQGTLMSPRAAMRDALADATIMAVVHPAYVLRNNNYQTNATFQQVVGSWVSQGDETAEPEIVLIREVGAPFEALSRDLRRYKVAAIDIETIPVPWWHEDSRVISVAISFDGQKAYVVDTTQLWAEFLDIMQGRETNMWVMHNGAFDRQYMLSRGVDLPLQFDTMTAQYLIDPESRKDLQYMSGLYLGLPPYKDVDYKHIEDEPWEKVGQMNGVDAVRTYRLGQKLVPRFKKDERLHMLMYELMLPAIETLLVAEIEGIPIDRERLRSVTEKYGELVRHAEDSLQAYAEQAGMPLPFNPRSTKQLNELVFNRLGLPVMKTTDTGNPSLDKEVRKRMKGKHPIIAALNDYKVYAQRLSSFLGPWDELERDGRIHTHYKPNHVKSGRLSSEKPNVQQVPRDPDIRSIFGGLPGYKLVVLDYSQLELRLAAHFSQEPTMLKAYREGADLHTLTAEQVLGDADGRQTGKVMNFGLIYGAGWRTFQEIALLQYDMTLSDAEAQRLRDEYFRRYSGLEKWHTIEINRAKMMGYVESPLGRRRYLPNIDNYMDGKARSHDEKVAINHGIQSFGSDLMLLSLTEMRRQGLVVVGTVHDSGMLLAKDEDAETVGAIAKDIMENQIPKMVEETWGVSLSVPLVADLTIADYWEKE